MALTIFSREYFGRRPIENNFSLIEILFAEGQLNLCLALTMFSREYFGQRLIKTIFSLIEVLLAEGQLKLFLPLTIFSREYFNWLSIEEKKKPLSKFT